MAARHDKSGGPEDGSRAQDGPDVVRVGHLIEDDQRPGLGARRQGRGVWLVEGLGFEQHALVHGVLAQHAVEIARGNALGRHLTRRQRLGEAVLGVLRHQQALDIALAVAQRGFDGVDPVEQHAALIERAAFGARWSRRALIAATFSAVVAGPRRPLIAVSAR